MGSADQAVALVVDDELANRFLIRNWLEPGMRVVDADCGEAALKALAAEPIDIVLLDVMMPKQSGIEVCRLIKRVERQPFLPVIILTALGSQADRNEALEAGADDFLTKPLDRRELQLRVAGLLRTRDQQRQIQAQLERLQRLEHAKEELYSLIMHDLRNPLSALFAYLEFLEEDLRGSEQHADTREALRAASHLREILDESLKVRLLEESALALRREPVQLAELVAASLEGWSGLARRRNIELSARVEGDPRANLDLKLTRRALDNLLSNALKYTAIGGDVCVSAAVEDGKLALAVSDRGPAIPAALKQGMFEKFGSVEAKLGKERKGVGLGLYLVKLVAHAHGGTVAVRDREGGGSIFEITLPTGDVQGAEPGGGKLGGLAGAAGIEVRAESGEGTHAADLESQLKSRFLDSMSHELRTPLNAIIGFSELLEEQASGRLNVRQLDQVRVVLNAGRQLLRLLNELLQVSTSDPARTVLAFEWTSLLPILEGVAAVVRGQAESDRVSIELEIQPLLPPLDLDVLRAKQVVFSLLTAAIGLAGSGGKVKLAAKVDGSRVLVALDAVPPSQAPQPGKPAKVEDLAIARRLIELHGGAISVEGMPGNGMRFTVTLPRLRGEEPLAQEMPQEAGSGPSLVLIVDDDAKASTLIASQLHAGGVSVAFARNAAEALRRAEELKPLAITLDLRMPGEDGFEVLNKLRAAPSTASIPVVVISVVDERQMALAHGAVDFIRKPVSGELLLKALEQRGVPVCRIKGRRILLVARETEAMHQVEAELRLAGCEVERAAPGLALPAAGSTDLVICDVSQDEPQALPLLAEHAPGFMRGPPVIAVVGDWNPQAERKPWPWPASVTALPLEDAVRADRLVRAIHRALSAG